MYLEILTPGEKMLQNRLTSAILPGLEGEITVLKNHAQLCASLKDGIVKAHETEKIVRSFFVKNALAFIDNDKVIVNCEYALEISEALVDEQVNKQILLCTSNLERKGKDSIFQKYWQTRLKDCEVIKNYLNTQNIKT